MLKKLFLVASICLMSKTAFAAGVWHTSKIKMIYPLADGSVILTFKSDSASCTNAGIPKHYQLKVNSNGVTETALNNIYSIAMLAFSTGKNLTIYFDDSTSSCYINRMLIEDED
ncbi:response regulator receiver protein [Aliikangiella coralliicola]|uniref:Response regulator receiver protein n=1 Tax=Aliikangiella coralliicola TaxID=2592383 RepID=A0A545UB14_9GAMM|nr:response regulator receiver protein [Aliikangiella coralliicola]TQV86651.1 response regulator receiver protein [Aliikangiella coralliicola]